MTSLLWLATFCLLLNLVLMDFPGSSTDPNSYGPYTVRLKDYSPCRGPKFKNLTTVSVKIENDKENCRLFINVTSHVATRINEIKTYIYLLKKDQNAKNLMWNFKVDNPCQHYAFGHLIDQLGAKNCLMKKKQYNSVLNFKELVFRFFGNSFFYGEFSVKSVFLAREGNIACGNVVYEFAKKTN